MRGLLLPGNIDIVNRPKVWNPEAGGISTVWSMSVGNDNGTVLIPRIREDGEVMSPQEAIDHYKQTGKHLGVFEDHYAADYFAQRLHEQQEEAGESAFPLGSLGHLAGTKRR